MKSVFRYGISSCPDVVSKVPLPRPVPNQLPCADRVERLHELVARAVLPRQRLSVDRAVDRVVGPGVQPDRHAVAYVRDEVIDAERAGEEEARAEADVEQPAGRDVDHRQEDPEVEERAAEVVRLDEDEHRAAPDQQQRPEVLQSSLRQHLALLAQVPGEEDDQEHLRELARLELERADMHPEARAVDGGAEPGHRGQDEQPDRRQAEEVLVALEPPVVAVERVQRDRERGRAATTIQRPWRNASEGLSR